MLKTRHPCPKHLWRSPGTDTYDPISPASGVRTYLDQNPAGLIAVTTHARTGLRRVLLGADAAAIVHASTAPALVVPFAT